MKSIKRFDLQSKNSFYVDFTQVLAGMAFNLLKLNSPQTNVLYAELLTLAPNLSSLVKGFDKTELTIEAGEDIRVGGIQISTLKSISVDEFNIEFHCDSNQTPAKLYYTWLSFMMNQETGLRYPRSFYEFDIDLFTFDRNAIDWVNQGDNIAGSVGKILTSFKERRSYLGCYVANMEKIQLSTTESGFVEGININFKVNRGMRIQYNPITIKY